MKTPITSAECRVTTTWWNSGSVMRGDYATGLESLHTELRVESQSPTEDVAKLIAMAERGCYVLSALDKPPIPTRDIQLNGEPLALE